LVRGLAVGFGGGFGGGVRNEDFVESCLVFGQLVE